MSEADLVASRSPSSTTRYSPATSHPSNPSPTRPTRPRKSLNRGTAPDRSYCARSSRRRHGMRSSATAPSPTPQSTGSHASPAPSTSRARHPCANAWAESESRCRKERVAIPSIGGPWNGYRSGEPHAYTDRICRLLRGIQIRRLPRHHRR